MTMFKTLTTSQIVIWALCVVATLFLASRIAVRMVKKGRLRQNDYFLLVALPCLYIGAGLLQSELDPLYLSRGIGNQMQGITVHPTGASSRLVGSIELLWVSIFCIKFCFLAQFKFYKPPYAYLSLHLTRHWWTAVGICVAAFVFTLATPIVLCSSSSKSKHCTRPS
jgi:hypothetical protein